MQRSHIVTVFLHCPLFAQISIGLTFWLHCSYGDVTAGFGWRTRVVVDACRLFQSRVVTSLKQSEMSGSISPDTARNSRQDVMLEGYDLSPGHAASS